MIRYSHAAPVLALLLATSGYAQLASPSFRATCTSVGAAVRDAASPSTTASAHIGSLSSGELTSTSYSARLLATCAGPSCNVPLCGDCDGNLVLDVLDALRGAQHAVGLVTLTGVAFESCDVDDDGDVDVLDVLNISRSAAGLPVLLVCC